MNTKKSLLFSFIIINIAIVVLFALAITLPWLVTWFVETRNKSPRLPAIVMLVCYPCVPVIATALFSLRKLIKNCLDDLFFGDQNLKMLKIVVICCLIATGITFIAGYYYLPFYVLSLACAGGALVFKVMKDIISIELDKKREKLYESVKDEL